MEKHSAYKSMKSGSNKTTPQEKQDLIRVVILKIKLKKQ